MGTIPKHIGRAGTETALGLNTYTVLCDPIAQNLTRIMGAETVNAGEEADYVAADFAAQPDFARPIVVDCTAITAEALYVRIDGTNRHGFPEVLRGVADAVETIVLESDNRTCIETVTNIHVKVIGGAATSATFTVGVNNDLGLPVRIAADADVKMITVDGVAEAATSINLANSSVNVATEPNGARDFGFTIQSSAEQ